MTTIKEAFVCRLRPGVVDEKTCWVPCEEKIPVKSLFAVCYRSNFGVSDFIKTLVELSKEDSFGIGGFMIKNDLDLGNLPEGCGDYTVYCRTLSDDVPVPAGVNRRHDFGVSAYMLAWEENKEIR